ncbi:hypothetical protein SAMN05444161_1808 [Rhizobiales bacterium GAS191]|nr:hypothetical protein SAMN05444161_1808 [Rhizobiales bacterium GAS191]
MRGCWLAGYRANDRSITEGLIRAVGPHPAWRRNWIVMELDPELVHEADEAMFERVGRNARPQGRQFALTIAGCRWAAIIEEHCRLPIDRDQERPRMYQNAGGSATTLS